VIGHDNSICMKVITAILAELVISDFLLTFLSASFQLYRSDFLEA
jgi:uncharacterized membrane protein YwzB